MNEDDNAIFLPDSSGRLIAVKVYSPSMGQDALLLSDSSGKSIAIKVAIPAIGETGFSIPDASGKYIMVKLDGIKPNPPEPTGWTDMFPPGAWGYSAKCFETWNGYIYHGVGSGAFLGFINRYSIAGGWEQVLNSTYYQAYNIYSLKVFGTRIYAGHDSGGVVNGGIARSADGSFGSFAQVFDSGSAGSYIQALETMGAAIYGMYYDAIAAKYKIISSVNGTVWNAIYTSATVNDAFWGLTTSGTTLYTMYWDLSAWPPASSDIYSSADGATWAAESWGFGAGVYPVGLKYLNGHLYAGLSSGEIWRDGVSVCTDPGGNAFYDFCECEGLLFAACGGIDARVYCSEDNGLMWSLIYQPTGTYTIMEAIESLGKRIYAGSSSNWDVFQSAEIK
jgi:hypothetical protein